MARLFHGKNVLAAAVLIALNVSQARAEDVCRAALTETGVNRLSEIDQDDLSAYTYDQSCRQSSTIHGLDTSFKMLKPYGIDGTSAGRYDSREAYCRAMASTYEKHRYNFRKVSQVVESSVKNWLSCVKWTTAGINVTPEIRRGIFTLALIRGLPSPAVIRGVRVVGNDAAECKGQTRRDGKTAVETLGEGFEYRLPDEEGFVITCTRTPQKSTLGEGDLIYPRVVVSIGTSDPKLGAFMLELEEEPLGTERWATEIQRTLDDLRSRNERLEASVTKLQAELQGTKSTAVTDVTLADATENGYGRDGHFAECKPGEIVVGVGVGNSQNARVKCAPVAITKNRQ